MTIYPSAEPEQAQIKTLLDRAMSPGEFNEVVEAILQGKYSWACVLILRFAGYNPLHYIPYRTYTRLLKENRQDVSKKREKYAINYPSGTQSYQNMNVKRQFDEVAEFQLEKLSKKCSSKLIIDSSERSNPGDGISIQKVTN
ncbi:MAG: HetP family heterocyst commitment protein [Cyanobacteria bacterium CRU_2_1]|nr:HetP family heterocyst commitment protein [Cyanobacteria bacterium CRU_2_1]